MARFLSGEQWTLLNAILDRLIPAEGLMPGAGRGWRHVPYRRCSRRVGAVG